MGHKIPNIGKDKFLGLIFDSKLSFIPHITSLKSRYTKSLDQYYMGVYRKVVLRLYSALISSKLDYGCIVYSSARPSYIKRFVFITKDYDYVWELFVHHQYKVYMWGQMATIGHAEDTSDSTIQCQTHV